MNTTKYQEQILQQAVQMDASVNFQLNGNMLIVPCPWEQDKEVTNGERVRYRGGIEMVYRQEKEQVLAFIQSRKEETVWK